VHRDIKPHNILFCLDGTCQLDFGSARILNRQLEETVYMAPEAVRGESPLPSSDIYSVGITCLELSTAPVTCSAHLEHSGCCVGSGSKLYQIPTIPSSLPLAFRDFIMACLNTILFCFDRKFLHHSFVAVGCPSLNAEQREFSLFCHERNNNTTQVRVHRQ